MRKIAIYTRYSSDNQKKTSCEDQDVKCREYIAKDDDFAGIPIESYHDAAISGYLIEDRPEMLRLLKDVGDKKIRIIFTEEMSRLSRNQEETSRIYKICQYHDVPIYEVPGGKVDKIHVGLKGTMNELALDDIANRTRRGQAGNIRKGKAAGGLPYGYKVRQLNDQGVHEPGLREIDPEQEKIVKRIYDEFCNGKTVAAIIRSLNEDGIPSQRGGKWTTSTIAGHKGRGDGILQNPIYKGEMQWNRNSFKRHPTTGTRHVRPNPEDEIEIREMPDLAIIDEAQWELVQKIREERSRKQKSERDTNDKLPFKVICGKCGAPMNRCDEKYLICSTFKTKQACSQNKKMRIDAIINAIYKHMTDEEEKDTLWSGWRGGHYRRYYESPEHLQIDLEKGDFSKLNVRPLFLEEVGREFFLTKLEEAAKAPADLLNNILAKVVVEYGEDGQICVGPYLEEYAITPDYDALEQLFESSR